MKKNYYYLLSLLILIGSCADVHKKGENEYVGELTATKQLVETGEKRFEIDTNTKAKPPYVQFCTDGEGNNLLTFLNPKENAIYFYNYANAEYIKQIKFDRQGANAIQSAGAYYVKSMDSIYVFNRPMIQVALSDSLGQISNRVTLLDKADKEWSLRYPQYMLSSVVPMMLVDDQLLLPGLAAFPELLANREDFRYTAYIDLSTGKAKYHHVYPEALYGGGVNWGGDLIQQPYPVITPKGEIAHSFTNSHDIYISNRNSDKAKKIYAGSNTAGTIRPIDHAPKRTPDELVFACYMEQDLYAAIIHDPYRKIYYRYLLHGIPNANMKTPINSKPLTIIMMDEQFNYLGETAIGTGADWNWSNSFVTPEGLNIERIGTEEADEDFLIFGVFNPKDI